MSVIDTHFEHSFLGLDGILRRGEQTCGGPWVWEGLKAHLAGRHPLARWLYDHAAAMGMPAGP